MVFIATSFSSDTRRCLGFGSEGRQARRPPERVRAALASYGGQPAREPATVKYSPAHDPHRPAARGVPDARAPGPRPRRDRSDEPHLRPVRPLHGEGGAVSAERAPRDVAVLLIHRVNNYLGHLAARELSNRGFLVLAMNSRFDNNEAEVIWEVIALDVKQGVEYLRRQPGIRKVVLFGHSGGAATLSFYQAVAEKGPSFCRAPQKLTVCGDELAGLPKADGIDPRRRLAWERRRAAAQPESRRRLRRGSQDDRTRARSVQPGQRLQPVWPIALFAGVQGEVLRRPVARG